MDFSHMPNKKGMEVAVDIACRTSQVRYAIGQLYFSGALI